MKEKRKMPSPHIEAGCIFPFYSYQEIKPVKKANNSYFFSSGIFLI